MGEIITRQQACKRLIRAAIASFVRGDEPLATHLCIDAAFRVCRDIVKRKDNSKDWLQKIIYKERFPDFMKGYARLANFLKHADADPDVCIDLFDIQTRNMHHLILLGSYYEAAFAISNDPFMRCYMLWYYAKHPDLISDNSDADIFREKVSDYGEPKAWAALKSVTEADIEMLDQLRILQPDLSW